MAKRRSNIYHRKDGRWEGRFHISGTKKYISVYGKTYNEAKGKLDKLTAKEIKEVKCTSMFVDVALKWLDLAKNRIKESSYYCYLQKLNKHIMPYFEKFRYSELSAGSVCDFIKEKFRQGFSAKYISDMVVIVKSIAKWANKTFGYVDRIAYVELPKVKRKEPKLLTKDEQITLQNILVNSENATENGIFLSMFTGIRIGELSALKWEDIDLENKILHISKTVQRIRSGSNTQKKTMVKICTPKTEKSVRDIPLPDFIVKQLKKIKRSDENFLLSGTPKFAEPRTVSNRFKRILKKAGLPIVNFHSLRHSFATNCLQMNFDVKTLSEILGHSDVSTTMRIYVHTSIERKRACMDRLSISF